MLWARGIMQFSSHVISARDVSIVGKTPAKLLLVANDEVECWVQFPAQADNLIPND
jgi:hypothetical protein